MSGFGRRLQMATGAMAATQVIGFRAANSAANNTSSLSLTVPSSVQTGDVMVLIIGWSIASGQALTNPSGWTQIGTQVSDEGQVASAAFTKVAGSGDAGSGVTLLLSAIGNIAAGVSAYSNVDNASPIDAGASLVEGSTDVSTHQTPSITIAGTHDWLVSAAIDKGKTAATTAWTQPAGDVLRSTAYNTGTSGVTIGVSDTNTAVAVGTYDSQPWTSDSATSRAITWTIALTAGTGNPTPPGGGGGSTTGMLIGAASSPTGSNGGWDNLIAKSGMMQISRTYDTGMGTNLPNFYYGPKQVSWFWSQGMTVAHTIKPNMALLAARDATTMANLNTLLQSARGQKVWWCLWHEPENDTVGVYQ